MKSQESICQDILLRIAMIEEFTSEGEDLFIADIRTQEAVMRWFEVIGEAVKRLDPELTAQQAQVPWRAYAGFRDVLIHQYDKIQVEKVWEAVRDDLAPLQHAIQNLLDGLSDEDE
jgi:uncharacterized protein with HEPN domain